MTPQPFIAIDRENAFMLYAAFTGDLERTAAALGVRPMDVLRVAQEEEWAEKLKPILDLKKSSKPGDVNRAINRAINFVQAHRLRMTIERVIRRLAGMTVEELEKYLFTASTEKGSGQGISKLSTRALADLASAVEKCHAMTYQALNDSMQERAKRNDGDSGIDAGDMHVKIAEAMRKAAASKTSHAQVFDARLEMAQAEVGQPIPEPEPPEIPSKPDPYND